MRLRLAGFAVIVLTAGCRTGENPLAAGGPDGRGLEPAVACTAPPADLVSWWPGDGHANDIEGFNHGSLQGGAGFAAGQVGQAFALDGIDDYVNFGNDASLQVSSGDFTIDAWVRFSALTHPPGANLGPPGDMSILDKMKAGAGNGDGWRLIKQDDDRFWFCLGGGCSPASENTVRSATSATTGAWFHLAVTVSADSFALYVNGVREDVKPSPVFTDTQVGDLLLGAHNAGTDARLNGLIDEVEVFDRALSGAEVAAIHAAGASGKCKPTCDGRVVTTTGTVNGGQIELTGGNDVWLGTAAAETVLGLGGDDRMCGEGGGDNLLGGAGLDRLFGGDEADVLEGGPDDDRLEGGAGDDELYGATAADPDAADSGDDQLRGDDGADQLFGGDGADQLQGGVGADLLEGGEGADQLLGGDDGDVLSGGAGDDLLRGNAGDDELYGATAAAPDAAGAGNDELRGDDGVDQLYGGDGGDQLQGDAGIDLLEGGDGADQLSGGDDDDELRGGEGDDRLRGNAGADAFNGQGGVDRAQDFVCGVDTEDGTVERGIPNCP